MNQIPILNNIISEIIEPLIWLIFALGFLFFLYGVYEMVRDSGSEEARLTGRRHVIWGLLGIFIMLSFWGIINLVCKTLDTTCGF